MQLSFDEVFRYSDVFNPISLQTLHAAGKVAGLNSEKQLIELGCGKGYPALFWASTFGVQVEGIDISKISVEYANARAKLLNLSATVQFFCRDLRGLIPKRRYDVVSSLGIESDLYGGREKAFKFFKNILKNDGVIIFSQPVWKKKPVPTKILRGLNCNNQSFLTLMEMNELILDSGLEQLGCFVSSKEDWELYVRSPIRSLQEMITNMKEPIAETKAMLEDFKTEHDAAGKYWDNVLWVLKPLN